MDFDGIGSFVDLIMNYIWMIIDGMILSGENGLMLIIVVVGIYVLEVLNIVNGCIVSDDMMVMIDMILFII